MNGVDLIEIQSARARSAKTLTLSFAKLNTKAANA